MNEVSIDTYIVRTIEHNLAKCPRNSKKKKKKKKTNNLKKFISLHMS